MAVLLAHSGATRKTVRDGSSCVPVPTAQRHGEANGPLANVSYFHALPITRDSNMCYRNEHPPT